MGEHSKADQDKATCQGRLKEVGTNSKEELRTLMRDRDIWRRSDLVLT